MHFGEHLLGLSAKLNNSSISVHIGLNCFILLLG
jgi:hypothetical protein